MSAAPGSRSHSPRSDLVRTVALVFQGIKVAEDGGDLGMRVVKRVLRLVRSPGQFSYSYVAHRAERRARTPNVTGTIHFHRP
jgi:hypothetical protein